MNILRMADHLRSEGFVILPLQDPKILDPVLRLINQFFGSDSEAHCRMSREEFHTLVETCQSYINNAGCLRRFVDSNLKVVEGLVGANDLFWVSVMKLRAVRPSKYLGSNVSDNVGFHRESLYASSEQVSFQFNCWMPVVAAASTSGMWYLPRSHIVPDEELVVEEDIHNKSKVERYSAGHRIGLPYAPKSIERSPIFDRANLRRFDVPLGSMVIFSSMLIHGGGVNTTEETRFSLDTGTIPGCRIEHNPPLFAAHGKCHYMAPQQL